MAFFGIKDRRTVETHLANNVTSCIFLNLNIGEVIRIIAPDMKNSQLFREETLEEAEKRRSSLVEIFVVKTKLREKLYFCLAKKKLRIVASKFAYRRVMKK